MVTCAINGGKMTKNNISIENFEDLGKFEDKYIQIVLRELESDDLALALKGTSNENIATVKRNMSERAKTLLEDTMEKIGAAPLNDVENAQQKILGIMLKLRGKGNI
jgi:flagellar motor switch protein FliG